MVTIEGLKERPRWVLHKAKWAISAQRHQSDAEQLATWHTYAECSAALISGTYDGLGVVLGDGVWGVDIDGCCDAVTGKFTAESREVVIALDSYGEYSPSGTGCHVLGLGKLPALESKRCFRAARQSKSRRPDLFHILE